MFGKGSKLYSIFRHKCPRCHEGNMFKGPVTTGIYNMHENCPQCKQPFELEPGFYWGAMYVGYGLSAGFLLLGFAFSFFVLGLSINQSYMVVLIGIVLVFAFIGRLARAIWINLYVHYDKKIAENISENKSV